MLAILAIVVFVVSAPFRRSRPGDAPAEERGGVQARSATAAADRATELANLEAARQAKYREIRDAELDHRTGKLSDADYEATDRALRSEAIEILRALDRMR